MLKADRLADLLSDSDASDPFLVVPKPDVDRLRQSGSASLNLRLGCWFATFRSSNIDSLDVYKSANDGPSEARLIRYHYVPFGQKFVLHPRNFVLGVTLEWLRLPTQLAGYVLGRSSWGRHGLVIETASGVHPGFTGCLTLELGNLGEVPIKIEPGVEICQLFVHRTESSDKSADKSRYVGHRRPVLGKIRLDDVALRLRRSTY